MEIWTKPLQDGSIAVGIFNRGDEPSTARVPLKDLQLHGSLTGLDLWAHRQVALQGDSYSVPLPEHGVALLKISPARKAPAPVQIAIAIGHD